MPERLGRVLMPKVSERRQREEVIKKLGVVPVRHMDMLLPGITLFLVGYGILIIYSATHSYTESLLVRDQAGGRPHHRPGLRASAWSASTTGV